VNHLSETPHLRLVTSAFALGLAMTGALVAAITLAAPASARSVTVTDPRNPPPRGDIREATYADHENVAVTTVHVRHLRSTGTLRTRITRVGSGVGYEAVVSASPGEELSTRLVHVTDDARTTVTCDLTATWSTQSDTIRVTVPQSCLRFGHFQSRHSFATSLKVDGSRDTAASEVVGRGDSPGCATAGEMRRVTDGQRLAAVHAHLDTAGRFGDGGAGGFSRVYRPCGGGRPYWVEYDGRSQQVVGKGREA
jgi:hypothetical protein